MTEASDQPTVDRILVEMTISAPADQVWDALQDRDKLYNWFGWEADSLRDEIDYIFFQYTRPDKEAGILWFEGVPDRFEIEPRGQETIFRVVRAEPAGKDWDGIYEDMVEGWISFVQQLRLAIERHGIAPRRTLYFSGHAKRGGSGPIAALGLADFRDTSDGQPHAATLPTGDTVVGQAWHRTPWQIGLTVPQWGNGLLIVTDKSVKDSAPHGRGMAILTTYDLSADDFAALEDRWKTWWDANYDPVPASEEACS